MILSGKRCCKCGTEGAIDKATGKAKETFGKATDNEEMEAEGKTDQLRAMPGTRSTRPPPRSRTPSRPPWANPMIASARAYFRMAGSLVQ
jgi:hypothetical protein